MSVIKLTNDVLLDQSNINGFKGIDTNNLLASTSSDYTATQDCVAVQSNIAAALLMKINDVSLLEYGRSASSDKASGFLYVKKGQTVNVNSKSTKIYGLKS